MTSVLDRTRRPVAAHRRKCLSLTTTGGREREGDTHIQPSFLAGRRPCAGGAKLALKQAGDRVGDFSIEYISLDDSTAQAGGWEPGQTSSNARKAIAEAMSLILDTIKRALVFDRSVEPQL